MGQGLLLTAIQNGGGWLLFLKSCAVPARMLQESKRERRLLRKIETTKAKKGEMTSLNNRHNKFEGGWEASLIRDLPSLGEGRCTLGIQKLYTAVAHAQCSP